NQDVGERLVVAEADVVARLQLLDEVGLEEQRFGFRCRGDELHARRLGDHSSDSGRVANQPGVALYALLEVASLADVEHLAVRTQHAVDTWTGRCRARVTADHLRTLRTHRAFLGRCDTRPVIQFGSFGTFGDNCCRLPYHAVNMAIAGGLVTALAGQ